MRRSILVFALSLCAAALSGCASKSSIPDLPDKLVEQGIVVARLYMPGSASWDNAKVDIDGKLHPSGLRDGFIAIALPPGEHYLAQLRVEGRQLSRDDSGDSGLRKVRGGGAPTYYYVPGSTTRTYFTTLAVKRRFQVEAGKITNLGLMVYLADDKASSGTSKQYHTFALDNSAEIGYYLETNYPALMGTIADHTPKLAPGNYVDPTKLPQLRRLIAAQEAKGKKMVTAGDTSVLYGDAGTLVAARPKSGGGFTFEVLDTGTLANIVDARRDGDRLVFLTAEAKLLTFDGAKLSQTRVPYRIHPVKMSSIGKNNLAIVDNHMTIVTSQDGGSNWTRYDGARVDTARSDIGMLTDAQGAYVYLGSRGIPSPILYLRAGQAAPEAVEAPPPPGPPNQIDITSFNVVIVRESGVFIVYAANAFHFRPNATRTWQIHYKPAVDCKAIGFDTAGIDLTVECGGVRYESGDSGRSWAKAGGA